MGVPVFYYTIQELLKRDGVVRVRLTGFKNSWNYTSTTWTAIAQSVWRLDTGWTVRESNSGGGEIFHTCPNRPWCLPSLLYNGYRVCPGGKSGRGVVLTPTTNFHLAWRLKKE